MSDILKIAEPLALKWETQKGGNVTAALPSGAWLSVLDRMTGFGFRDTETAYCKVVDGKRITQIATSYDIRQHVKNNWTEAEYLGAICAAGNWWQALAGREVTPESIMETKP
jgi:hypothetical protein